MFDKFSKSAVHVLMLAQEEAKQLHHDWCGAEHILLGLLGQGGHPATVMKGAGLTLGQLRAEIGAIPNPEHLPKSWIERVKDSFGGIPFTDESQKVLQRAWEEARIRKDNNVDEGDIFLSMLKVEDGVLPDFFERHHLDLNELQKALLEHRSRAS